MIGKARFGAVAGVAAALCISLLAFTPSADAQAPTNDEAFAPQTPLIGAGQSATQLPSGQWLILSPQGTSLVGKDSPNAAAAASQAPASRPATLRTWHTATMLPTGKVLVFGGLDSTGKVIAQPELYDPALRRFQETSIPGLAPRAKHTATVLTSGEVLIAGGIPDATPVLWNPRTNEVHNTAEGMLLPRSEHKAALLSTSPVLIWGGKDQDGRSAAGVGELYQRSDDSFEPQDMAKPDQVPASKTLAQSPVVAESVPANKTRDVPVDIWPAVRFSRYLSPATLNADTVTLYGPSGPEQIAVNPVDSGLLVFVAPVHQLLPDADYTLFVRGAAGAAGEQLPFTTVGFHTQTVKPASSAAAGAAASSGYVQFKGLQGADVSALEDSVWVPNQDNFARSWRLGVAPANSTKVPMLRAAPGVTAMAGQILLQSGRPLSGVTVSIGGVASRTDNFGRFLVSGIPAGHNRMYVDGRTANSSRVHFGQFVIGVNASGGATTPLTYAIWMPVIDEAHAVNIESPTKSETVVTTPLIPGLELHIPKGAVLREPNGNIVTKVSITPVPLDRPPFPTPDTPGFFTIQPGGAYLQAVRGASSNPGMKLYYPNSRNLPNGTRINFMDYDPDGKGWYVYGQATVNAPKNQIQPDNNVALYQFMGAMYGQPDPTGGGGCAAGTCTPPPPAPTPDGCQGTSVGGSDPGQKNCPATSSNSSPTPSPKQCSGDPVDCATGLFIYSATDLYLPDTIPVDLTRTYNSGDASPRNFGAGFTHSYHMWLYQESSGAYDVVQPNGSFVRYQPTSTAGQFIANNTYGGSTTSVMSFSSSTSSPISIKYKTGYTYQFSPLPGHPLSAIISPAGQTLHINVDYSKADRPVISIVSPHGRSITFSYVPGDDTRIQTATDNIGRSVSYHYDSGNRLDKVTYPDLSTETYTYDGASTRIASVTNANQHVVSSNTYTNGQVTLQQRADGGQFHYAYATSGTNTVTTVTDPLGKEEQFTFDASGYLIQDIKGYTSSIAETFTYTRDSANNDRITQEQDAFGRKTDYTYDAVGNVKSITTEATSTTPATSVSYGYEPVCNLINSVTDPLGVSAEFTYDSQCNLLHTADSQGTIVASYTPDAAGRVHIIKDAQGNAWTYTYTGADLTSVTDPIGRTVQSAYDAVGHLLTVRDGLGATTTYTVDVMDRLRTIVDPLGHQMAFDYYPAGNLKAVTTASGTTTFAYYNTELPQARTDPLSHAVSYTYDTDFNLVQVVDRNGNTDKFSYDALNRQTDASYAFTNNVLGTRPLIDFSYTYDAGNRVTQVTQTTQTIGLLGLWGTPTVTNVARIFDGLNRLTQITSPIGAVSYTYYANGLRHTMTPASQAQITYGYDPVNRLTSITQGGQSVSIGYDTDRRRGTLNLPNGIQLTYGYTNASEVNSLSYTNGGVAIGNLVYGYDGAGQVSSVTGSLAGTSLPAALSNATYDANDRLTNWGGTTFSYDANGNMTAAGSSTLTWNAVNQLIASSGGGVSASYIYDAVGRRQQRTVGATTTSFLYDGLNPIQESSGSTVTATVLTGLQLDEIYARTDSSGTKTFVSDAQNTTVALADSSGLHTTYTYEPYGNVIASGAASSNTYEFTGRENDGTAIYYYRGRYYSPLVQRFISEDPIGLAGGPNLYAYVGASPTNFSDPLGLKPGDCYPTKDLAGANAVNDINYQSIKQDREYAGRIYRNTNGTYSYTAPVAGKTTGSDPGPIIPNNVGDYHTHGAHDPNDEDPEVFSPTDISATTGENNTAPLGDIGYLGTPSGVIKKYDPNTGRTSNLPYPSPNNGDACGCK